MSDLISREEAIEKIKRLPITYDAETVQRCIEVLSNSQTIYAVPIDGSFLKMSRGNYLIYERHWLYEHLDQEMDIQRSVMTSMGYEHALKDTEPVRHGKWIVTPVYIKCHECGESFMLIPQNYCPHCGARMDAK